MPSNKKQEKRKNSRVKSILRRLVERPPTIDEMEQWKEQEPEFPTFPGPAYKEKLRKSKKSPYLS